MGWLLVSAVAVMLVVGAARAKRGVSFALFSGAMLTLHTVTSAILAPHLPGPLGLWIWLQVAVFVHFLSLVRARMRSLPWRVVVSMPGHWFWAGSALALPWAVAVVAGLEPHGLWVPYALAGFGLVQSLRTKRRNVDLTLDGEDIATLRRYPLGTIRNVRPLRLVQITDPHLGPCMSVARLQRICQRAVDAEPDLILLTGDYLTMDGQGSPGSLAKALEPLRAVSDRVYACLGNHDHEAPEEVASAMAAVGVTLLVDAAVSVETPAGRVQVVGADFTWKLRDAKLAALCAACPREAGSLRLLLLHDPSMIRNLPRGEADLVLSGHTHGGQVGLVSLGLRWTMISALFRGVPDHGFWARGCERMYVHRATGHYGFLIRLGVPAEEGVVRVHRVR
ncbi:MAG: putative MPP superfamily phosphohydrolase [Myxococcota bacterium]|jgi:predicted MPP superfamily phosphohydrolase